MFGYYSIKFNIGGMIMRNEIYNTLKDIWYRKLSLKRLIIITVIFFLLSIITGVITLVFKSSNFLNLFGIMLILTVTAIFLTYYKYKEKLRFYHRDNSVLYRTREMFAYEKEVIFNPNLGYRDSRQFESYIPFFMLYSLQSERIYKLTARFENNVIKLRLELNDNSKCFEYEFADLDLFLCFFDIKE